MGRSVDFHDLFDCDVREAARWYEQQSPNLGNDFADHVWRCVDDVISDPDRYGQLPSGCRYKHVTKFPYVVVYDLSSDEILILTVVHTARSPEKWDERLKDS